MDAAIIGWAVTPGSGRYRGTCTITAPNSRRFRVQGRRLEGRRVVNELMRTRRLALGEPRDVPLELPDGVEEIERRKW